MCESEFIYNIWELSRQQVYDFSPYLLSWYESGNRLFCTMGHDNQIIGLHTSHVLFSRQVIITDATIRLTTMKE
jgi:hypothetical protein